MPHDHDGSDDSSNDSMGFHTTRSLSLFQESVEHSLQQQGRGEDFGSTPPHLCNYSPDGIELALMVDAPKLPALPPKGEAPLGRSLTKNPSSASGISRSETSESLRPRMLSQYSPPPQLRAGAEWQYLVAFLCGVVFIAIRMLPGGDSEHPWKTPLYYCLLLGFVSSFSIYMSKTFSARQARLVFHSIIFYQILVVMMVNFLVSVLSPEDEQDSMPFLAGTALMTFVMTMSGLALDMCITTKAEAVVCFFAILFGISFGFYMTLFVWDDALVYTTTRYSNATAAYGGSFTRMEIRRNCYCVVLLLIVASLKDTIKDRNHIRLYFVKRCRVKRDVQKQIESGIYRVRLGVHWTMRVAWLLQVLTTLMFIVLRGRPDDEIQWFIYFLWIEVITAFVCIGIYLFKFGVASRVPDLLTSLLAWQIVVFVCIGSIIGMTMPDAGKELQVVPGWLLTCVWAIVPIVLDCCETSKSESSVTLALWMVSMTWALLGSLFFYPDMHAIDGFEDPRSGFAHGEYTKNEIRRTCFQNAVLLLLGSLKDSYFDSEHRCMYFVRDAQIKPAHVRRLWMTFKHAARFEAVRRRGGGI